MPGRGRSGTPSGPDLFERDELRLRLDHRRRRSACPCRPVTLSNVSTALPPRLTTSLKVFSAVSADGCDVDRDVVAGRAGLEGGDPEGAACLVLGARQLGLGRGHRAVRADADDVRGAAAVEEVAVDGVREVRALDEVAERLGELAPVRDERGRVRRPPRREADEGGDGRPDAFDRARPGLHLLDVDTGRQIVRHAWPFP